MQLWKPKNWQTMSNIQEVGENWASENCSDDVSQYLTYKPDGIYEDFPDDFVVVKLDDTYVKKDWED
jgi:hypothetical protein